MNFERNSNNRIILLNQKGEKEEFLYSVDAREALALLDSEKKHRYALPEKKKEKIANVEAANVVKPEAAKPQVTKSEVSKAKEETDVKVKKEDKK